MIRQLFFIALAFVVVVQIAHGKTKCQKERDSALSHVVPGEFIPECKDNGDYATVQCGDGAYCSCTDPKTGAQIGEAKQFGNGLNCS